MKLLTFLLVFILSMSFASAYNLFIVNDNANPYLANYLSNNTLNTLNEISVPTNMSTLYPITGVSNNFEYLISERFYSSNGGISQHTYFTTLQNKPSISDDGRVMSTGYSSILNRYLWYSNDYGTTFQAATGSSDQCSSTASTYYESCTSGNGEYIFTVYDYCTSTSTRDVGQVWVNGTAVYGFSDGDAIPYNYFSQCAFNNDGTILVTNGNFFYTRNGTSPWTGYEGAGAIDIDISSSGQYIASLQGANCTVYYSSNYGFNFTLVSPAFTTFSPNTTWCMFVELSDDGTTLFVSGNTSASNLYGYEIVYTVNPTNISTWNLLLHNDEFIEDFIYKEDIPSSCPSVYVPYAAQLVCTDDTNYALCNYDSSGILSSTTYGSCTSFGASYECINTTTDYCGLAFSYPKFYDYCQPDGHTLCSVYQVNTSTCLDAQPKYCTDGCTNVGVGFGGYYSGVCNSTNVLITNVSSIIYYDICLGNELCHQFNVTNGTGYCAGYIEGRDNREICYTCNDLMDYYSMLNSSPLGNNYSGTCYGLDLCAESCTPEGSTKCSDDTHVLTCTNSTNACKIWISTGTCPSGTYCSGGLCIYQTILGCPSGYSKCSDGICRVDCAANISGIAGSPTSDQTALFFPKANTLTLEQKLLYVIITLLISTIMTMGLFLVIYGMTGHNVVTIGAFLTGIIDMGWVFYFLTIFYIPFWMLFIMLVLTAGIIVLIIKKGVDTNSVAGG